MDEYLVASAKAGDRRAFHLLARRWGKKLAAHAWRLTGDVDVARDVSQEAWVEIVRSIGRLRDERAFPSWAYRIVSRRCARHIKGAVQRRDLAEAVSAEPPEESRQEAETAMEHERLRAAVRRLPQSQRAAVALFHFEELSVAEVAVALNVPVGTVKTRLMHARRKLRDALEGEEQCETPTC
ncbi:RNA polymerase sigma factor [Allopontixanthobacter sp.]|uniref:RNA polymerase sigma factor n=1 Tax=Allopontixanthobacter sp. TaxID=2906452 RepID=UPI002ABB00BA|nr:RNA polymerase sigma factor [Allopontixanthobacter sp.]MDZ4308079.1 RNA polymerase sigma factor [Allopontixanthobacter sp.]